MHTCELLLFFSLLLMMRWAQGKQPSQPLIPIQFDDERLLNPTRADDDDDDGDNHNILMLGNSYTSYNNLASIVQALFDESIGYTASISALTRGGMRLYEHASSAQSPGNQWNTALTMNQYDFVILQDQSQIPSFTATDPLWLRSKDGAVSLDAIIEEAGATTIFFLTWGYRDGDAQNAWMNPDYSTMQANLELGYRRYAEHITAASIYRRPYIAPVGLAYKAIYDEIISDGGTPENQGTLFYDLYTGDGSHPTSLGSYLAACVIYSSITGNSSLGMSDTFGFDSEIRQKLQMAADSAVFDIFLDYDYPFQTSQPTISSSPSISFVPSVSLSLSPSITSGPSCSPSDSVSPSKHPSLSPSSEPSRLSSRRPSESVLPSEVPSDSPTHSPSTSAAPSTSIEPSGAPTPVPSARMTNAPTPTGRIPNESPTMPCSPFEAQTISAELGVSSVARTIPRLSFLMQVPVILLITCLLWY